MTIYKPLQENRKTNRVASLQKKLQCESILFNVQIRKYQTLELDKIKYLHAEQNQINKDDKRTLSLIE